MARRVMPGTRARDLLHGVARIAPSAVPTPRLGRVCATRCKPPTGFSSGANGRPVSGPGTGREGQIHSPRCPDSRQPPASRRPSMYTASMRSAYPAKSKGSPRSTTRSAILPDRACHGRALPCCDLVPPAGPGAPCPGALRATGGVVAVSPGSGRKFGRRLAPAVPAGSRAWFVQGSSNRSVGSYLR
jgi:hypothetical protein